ASRRRWTRRAVRAPDAPGRRRPGRPPSPAALTRGPTCERPYRRGLLRRGATSESLGDASPLQRVLPIGAGHFAAQSRCRKDLAWVADAGGIERAAPQLHRLEIVGAEHLRHLCAFVRADAVLAGDGPARFDAVREDLGCDLLGPIRLPGLRLVVA